MDYFKKIKEYWLVSTIILCLVVFGTTWTLYVNLIAEPRNSEIEKSRNENTKLEREIESLHSQATIIDKTENIQDHEEKSLMEGTSFTSKFGFIVYISDSDNDLKQVSIYITLENTKHKNKNLRNVGIGKNVKINHANNNYSIEINNIRGNWVDLIIRKNA